MQGLDPQVQRPVSASGRFYSQSDWMMNNVHLASGRVLSKSHWRIRSTQGRTCSIIICGFLDLYVPDQTQGSSVRSLQETCSVETS
jgi:hypothetical protein